MAESAALTTQIARRDPSLPVESEEERATAVALARLDRVEMVLQAGVLAGWLGAGLMLGALSDLVFAYPHMAGMLIMSGCFAGLLAPAAISWVRGVKDWVQQERLRLARFDGEGLEHLSATLHALVLDTRVVRAILEGRASSATATRTLWDWTRRVDALPEHEREWIAGLGLGSGPVRELVFADDGGPQVRASLSPVERRRLVRELDRFIAVLVGARGLPYR